jgi:hypothetical protein
MHTSSRKIVAEPEQQAMTPSDLAAAIQIISAVRTPIYAHEKPERAAEQMRSDIIRALLEAFKPKPKPQRKGLR